MNLKNKLGIWMNHSEANLITCANDAIPIMSIYNSSANQGKELALGTAEKLLHHKNQQQHHSFYNDLADEILLYSDVVLFGPSDAKMELFTMLRADLRFDEITIEVASFDKTMESQKKDFVKTHFMDR